MSYRVQAGDVWGSPEGWWGTVLYGVKREPGESSLEGLDGTPGLPYAGLQFDWKSGLREPVVSPVRACLGVVVIVEHRT